MTVSFCIPWQPTTCPVRGEVFAFLQHYYTTHVLPHFPGSELVVAGDDSGDVLLCRSRMRNNCARQARGDVLFFIDADCLFTVESISAALAALTDDVAMVQFPQVLWVTESVTRQFLRHLDHGLVTTILSSPAVHALGTPDQVLIGLVYVVRADDYARIGGFCEAFSGWGEEDPAFVEALTTLVGPRITLDASHMAVHLWHPRTAEHDVKSPGCLRNAALRRVFRVGSGHPARLRRLLGLPRVDGEPETTTYEHLACFGDYHGIGYSQHGEEAIIADVVGGSYGRFLEIGAGDGITHSNVRGLCERGWSGVCVEPSPSLFPSLCSAMEDYPVTFVHAAIHSMDGPVEFWDLDLLGTECPTRWHRETMSPIIVPGISPETFLRNYPPPYDVISIDAGVREARWALPWARLRAPVFVVACTNHDLLIDIVRICIPFGYELHDVTPDNAIFVQEALVSCD